MNITLTLNDGTRVKAKLPYEGCEWVETDRECPSGGHYLDVACKSSMRTHNTIEGEAFCKACNQHVGRSLASRKTIEF